MHRSRIVFLINDDVRAIAATYEENQKPTIFKTLDPDIEVDDLVVVETNTRHQMTVVKVTEIDVDVDIDSGQEINWVVHRVDQNVHDDIISKEQEAIRVVNNAEKRRKKEELRASVFAAAEDDLKMLGLTKIDEDEVTE